MTNSDMVKQHYDALIDENNDPVHDPPPLKAYMDKWDGKAFIDGMQIESTHDVLEIGIGTGRLATRVCGICKSFTGIDISPKTIKRARVNLHGFNNVMLICEDFSGYRFDKKFDIIYSSLTFIHMPNKKAAIEKVYSLLNRNGRFLLSISKSQEKTLEMNGRVLELFPATPDEIIEMFKVALFTVDEYFETDFGFVVSGVNPCETKP